MTTDILHPHAQQRILHRQGALYAVWPAGTRNSVPLTEADLCLLAAFLGGSPASEVADAAAAGKLSRYLPDPSPRSNVVARIRQLLEAGVLTADSPGQITDHADTAGLGSLPRLEDRRARPTGQPLRVGSNFALQPLPSGFRAWSAMRERHFDLEPELALLLTAFGMGRSGEQVVTALGRLGEERMLAATVDWLFGAGLLSPVIRTAVAPAEQTAPVHVVTDGAQAGPDWREIEPDGRIPVYFTPHMENHFPLALGMMHSAIRAHDGGSLLERFLPLPLAYFSPAELFKGPYRKFGPGVWLFSNYMWSLDVNLQISAGIKEHHPGNFCIHGGPSTPGYQAACTAFMAANPSADVAVHGEGEVTIVELLACLGRREDTGIGFDPADISQVNGLTFRNPDTGALKWTAPRDRMRELDLIPSPYLEGLFDAYHGRVEAAIVESNRGCPFGCTFCDWGSATRQKVRKFDMERVRREIEWIGRNRIRVLWIADANFGMYDRDVDLARHIVATKAEHGYPREVVVNYTKNTNKRLIEIIRAFSEGGIISQGIISIQTTDATTLEVINRKNIKTDKYDELAGVFAQARLPLSTDLMIGLPGITVEAWNRDLQRYFDADVSVKAYPTQLLPNSPMADPDYMAKYRIETDDKDFVVACHSFDRAELDRMKAVYYAFEIADGYGVLRYLLRYLQWDHDLPALEVISDWLEATRSEPEHYPNLTWVRRFFLEQKSVPGGWRRFYDEFAGFLERRHGIVPGPAMEVALKVNELAMPDDTRVYPHTESLPHDFEAWFQDRQAGREPAGRLEDYPPGRFTVDDPDLMAHIDMNYQQYDSHQYFWELRSAIARPKSVSDVREVEAEVA